MERMKLSSYCLGNLRVSCVVSHTFLLISVYHVAPIECYIMQGEHPLPQSVVEKFAKTGGELCKNVFLLSKLPSDTIGLTMVD